MNLTLILVLFVLGGCVLNPAAAIPPALFWFGAWALWRRHKRGSWQGVWDDFVQLPQSIWAAVRGPRREKTASYTKHEISSMGCVAFRIVPAKAPTPIMLYLVSVVLLGMTYGLGTSRESDLLWGFGPIFLLLWLVFYYHTVVKPSKWRSETHFVVETGAGIALGGGDKSIRRADIARFVLRNHITVNEVSNVYVVGGTGVAGVMAGVTAGAGAVAAQIGAADAARIAKVCWRFEVEAGGRAHVLAGGLDETTAYGLMSQTIEVL